MKPTRTPQWLNRAEFLKMNRTFRMRLLLAPCFLFTVVTPLAIWLRSYCEACWPDSPILSKDARSNNFVEDSYDSTFLQGLDALTESKIWFLETSTRRTLTARQACSIESACFHNSDYTVHLLSTGNITDSDCPYHRVLSTLRNFHSEPLNPSAVLAGTPLSSLHAEGAFLRGPYSTQHLSDFLRYAVLWKRGGVYLDTDVIVFRSLSGIRNSAVCQDDDEVVANGILFFDRRHPALEALMQMCATRYDPNYWVSCGPKIMSLLRKDVLLGKQVNFLEKTTFLAVPHQEWMSFFECNRTQWVMEITNGSYGTHFWNKLSEARNVTPGSCCAMNVMARTHCPRVYELASLQSYF